MPHILALDSGRGFDGRLWSFAGTTAGVFRSGDRGSDWDYVGLIEVQVPAIAMHPVYASRPNCYVGTQQDGVSVSTNGGLTWQSLGLDLGDPRIQGVDVGLDDMSHAVVFAATQTGICRYGGAPRDPQPPPLTQMLVLPLVLRAT